MNDAARIAVLEANFKNLLRKSDEHEERDEDRFDRMFTAITVMKEDLLEGMGDMEDKFMERFADLNRRFDNKVEPMWDERSERRGAFKMSNVLAHGLTGLVSVAAALGLKRLL
jgi:hypothetical protein